MSKSPLDEIIFAGRCSLRAAPPKHIVWAPQPDITTYELALAMPALFAIGKIWDIEKMIPAECRRHFEVRDDVW